MQVKQGSYRSRGPRAVNGPRSALSRAAERLLHVLALPCMWGLLAGMQRPAPLLVHGQTIPADGSPTEGTWVVLHGGAATDSARMDRHGRFAISLSPLSLHDPPPPPNGAMPSPEDTVALLLDVRGGRFHPALLRLPADSLLAEVRVVLIPREWTLRTGAYAGRTVSTSLADAFARACTGCTSFFRSVGGGGGATHNRVQSWPDTVFPLRLAFDREQPGGAISARDSAGFWQAVDQLERTVGLDLFRPAPLAEFWQEGPDNFVLVWADRALAYAGLGSVASRGGNVVYGALRLRRGAAVAAPEGPALVGHELLHTLGLGHTCGWPSLLAESARCPTMRSPVATPRDVAYLQLLLRVRTLQRIYQTSWGIEAAREGEAFLKKLPVVRTPFPP